MKSSILKELQRIELAIRGIDPLADIAELEAAQSDMQALITALQAADTSLQATDASLWDQIVSNSSTSANLQSQISSNDSDISGHNSRISALEAGGGGGGIVGYAYAWLALSSHGGTATSGAWRQWPLNNISSDLPGVTLSGNSIAGLPAGMYILAFNSPLHRVNRHQAKAIVGSNEFLGSSEYASAANSDTSSSALHRGVDLAALGNASLYYRCETSNPTAGLGIDTAFGINVYGYLSLIKVG